MLGLMKKSIMTPYTLVNNVNVNPWKDTANTFFLLVLSSYFRNSRLYVFCKRGARRNFAKFTGKHLCQSLFFNKISSLLF